MSKIEDAKQLVANREYDKLEDLWADLITEGNIEIKEYLAITDVINELGESSRASLLLELLSEYYETQGKCNHALEVQKHMLRYQHESEVIRKKIIRLYTKIYTEAQYLEDYLGLSGLSKNEPIMKAILKFEEYLRYDIGQYFFFERYGMGQVVDVNPKKKEIVIDFERKKRHFLSLDVARGLLTPINKQHFLYQKFKKIETLKALADSGPVELIVLLLNSMRQPLSASQIKSHLSDIIGKDELNKFWEKVRKALEKHDNIRVAGRNIKTYAYIASAEDKKIQAIENFHRGGVREKYQLAEEYAKKMPAVFEQLLPHLVKLGNQLQKKLPGVALDILMLLENSNETGLQYSARDILRTNAPEEILKDMTNHEHQSRLLSTLKEIYPDKWIDITCELIFISDDFKLLDSLVGQLENAPRKREDVYHKILAMPKQYPKQFQWMLKRIETGSLREYLKPTLVPRLLDSLEYVRGVKATVKKILSLANFDAIIAQAQVDEAGRIRDTVSKSSVLTEYEKKNLMRIIEHHFPELTAKKADIIYTTEAALKRKKEELNHILTVAIPENKKEISRAREFGDLSENFEYKAAKEKQDQLYVKVKRMESDIQRAQLIDHHKIDTRCVAVGTTISLKNLDDNSIVVYSILGRWDTDLERNVISNEAPLARSLLDKKVGDRIQIEGIDHEIMKISKTL